MASQRRWPPSLSSPADHRRPCIATLSAPATQVARLVEHEPDRSYRAPRPRRGALPLRQPRAVHLRYRRGLDCAVSGPSARPPLPPPAPVVALGPLRRRPPLVVRESPGPRAAPRPPPPALCVSYCASALLRRLPAGATGEGPPLPGAFAKKERRCGGPRYRHGVRGAMGPPPARPPGPGRHCRRCWPAGRPRPARRSRTDPAAPAAWASWSP
jgi:hypothetical protein